MENYIVSARKYRPQSFSTLIGQDSIASTLKNSIQRGQLAHAYLFCGPRGVGKTTSARIFAKIINCSNPGENMEPCGECESCRSFAEGRSYCIHELDAASNNSVDDIRELTDKVQIPPQTGRYSVYIIDEVHMLSQAAFNAFLKTLEEPPEYAIFILATTEKHKILPTILSRCQTYDFNRIGVEDIVRNLRDIAAKEGVTIDDESMHVIATKADGAMRDALTLFDQTVAFCGDNITYSQVIKNLNVLDYDYYFNIIRSSLGGQYAKSLLLFDEVLAKGFNAQYFVSGLSSHIRNLLVCKDSSTSKLLETSQAIAAKYMEQASLCSVKYLFDALTLTTRCEVEYKNSPSQRLLVEFLLVKLASLAAPLPESKLNLPPAIVTEPSPAVSKPLAAPAPVQTAEPVVAPAVTVPEAPKQVAEPAPVAAPAAPAPAAVPTPAETNVQTYAPDPVPAKAEVTQAAEPVKPEPRKTSIGMSITNMLGSMFDEEEQQEQEKAREAEHISPITAEGLARAWVRMTEDPQVAKYPNLVAAIKSTSALMKEDGTTIVFPVTNSAQKSWIEKKILLTLENILREQLDNFNLKLLVEMSAPALESKPRVPYMPVEKDAHLQREFPEYAQLKKELDLDLK